MKVRCARSIGSFNSGSHGWVPAFLSNASTQEDLRRRDVTQARVPRALTTRSSALSSATVSQRCGDPRHAIDQTEAVGLSLIRFASFSFPSIRRGAARRGVAWRGVVWCGVVWCGAVWYGMVWCGVWCGVVCCGVVWCGVVL